MIKFVITKTAMIKAVQTQPLWPGHWVSSYGMPDTCTVCVVGAILRYVGIKGRESIHKNARLHVEDLGEFTSDSNDPELDDETINDLLKRDLYLNAISVYFEGMETHDIDGNEGSAEWLRTSRIDLVSFIKYNVPDNYRLGVTNL